MRSLLRAAPAALFLSVSVPALASPSTGPAVDPAAEVGPKGEDEAIIATGTRTRLPITALPLTVDLVSGKAFIDQVAVSGLGLLGSLATWSFWIRKARRKPAQPSRGALAGYLA
ncbi:hypothetical protein [Sphingomonas xanthus]|uniref:Uncharacterized protein n=1 Tax=Sphingomonas xanthus TaxID=2594473 RepID=A0A516IRY4_9SPHN|nr:hypothetical protein [Sphingomonas xanthus]QDP19656.1 hypothetical protein FMM02_06610 [Sphingomonas xanthus]